MSLWESVVCIFFPLSEGLAAISIMHKDKTAVRTESDCCFSLTYLFDGINRIVYNGEKDGKKYGRKNITFDFRHIGPCGCRKNHYGRKYALS